MTGMQALEYIRTHRYGAVRCKDWEEDVFILIKASGFEVSWAHYRDDDLYDRHSINKENPEDTVFSIFENFFDQLFDSEWEIFDAKDIVGNQPVKCGWNEYYDPRYPDERFPEAE